MQYLPQFLAETVCWVVIFILGWCMLIQTNNITPSTCRHCMWHPVINELCSLHCCYFVIPRIDENQFLIKKSIILIHFHSWYVFPLNLTYTLLILWPIQAHHTHFHVACIVPKDLSGPELCFLFHNVLRFYGEELLAPHPNSKLKDHHCLLFATSFSVYLQCPSHIWRTSPPSTAWGHTMPLWQGPFFHGYVYHAYHFSWMKTSQFRNIIEPHGPTLCVGYAKGLRGVFKKKTEHLL